MKTRIKTFLLVVGCLLGSSNFFSVQAQIRKPDRRPGREQQYETQDPSGQSQRIYNRVTQSLRRLDYPVNQLPSGASYIPDQLMVWYPESELGTIQQIRDKGTSTFGNKFKVAKTCGCQGKFQIELYEIEGMDINEEGDSGSNKAAKAMGIKEEDEQDNLYLMPYLPQSLNAHGTSFGTLSSFKVKSSGKSGDPVVIAILDTGIDYRYQNQQTNGEPTLVFWENKQDPVDGKDDANDPFCFTDDIIGWDFVNNDNNPMDDHSHGTHLAGIVAEQLRTQQSALNYQLMALKVMDANGVGNTFDAVCGILYAAEKGAKVINASWGYYGGSEKLLQRAIRYASSKGAVVVNSAGNERADLAITNYYPAEYALLAQNSIRSLMFVGATDTNGDLWENTNIRTEGIYQDGFIATPGDSILSLIPLHLKSYVSPYKSGTSMAAPVMSAIMANYIYSHPKDTPSVIRSNVIDLIFNTITPGSIRRNGKVYPYYPVKWLDFSP